MHRLVRRRLVLRLQTDPIHVKQFQQQALEQEVLARRLSYVDHLESQGPSVYTL